MVLWYWWWYSSLPQKIVNNQIPRCGNWCFQRVQQKEWNENFCEWFFLLIGVVTLFSAQLRWYWFFGDHQIEAALLFYCLLKHLENIDKELDEVSENKYKCCWAVVMKFIQWGLKLCHSISKKHSSKSRLSFSYYIYNNIVSNISLRTMYVYMGTVQIFKKF